MIKDVHIRRRELGSLIEGRSGFLRTILGQRHDTHPHPSMRVFRISGGFFLKSRQGLVEFVQLVVGDAEKEIRTMQPRLQGKSFLEARNRFGMVALLLKSQAEVEVR